MTTSVTDTDPVLPVPTLASRAGELLRRRATWVLIDQAVVSGGNFLTNWLLLRHLPQEAFGIFNVLLETLNYLNSLQAALIVYPLTIKGATGDRANLARMATASVLLTFALLPLLGGATAWSVGALGNGGFTVAAITALLLWQIQETLRRGLMADLRFADAVWGDALRYLGQVGIIYFFARHGTLTLNQVFLVMGFTSVVATILQAFQLGMKWVWPSELVRVAIDFWRLGRWVLLTNASGIITSLGFWWVLRWMHGNAACAVWGAIVLPFKLANPVMASMTGLIVPAVARAASQEGLKAANRTALRYAAFGAALLLPFFLILTLFPRFSLAFFSRANSPYVVYGNELRMFVANYIVVYFSTVIGAWIAGLGHNRLNFNAQVIGVIATLFVGLPFTAKWGVQGLIVGGLISAGASTLASVWFLRRVETHLHY